MYETILLSPLASTRIGKDFLHPVLLKGLHIGSWIGPREGVTKP